MGVKTKRGGDNKLRKTGDVGSHSTLVTEAKTPTTNIDSVKIDGKTKLVKVKTKVSDNPSTLAEAKAYLKAVKAEEKAAKNDFSKAKLKKKQIKVLIKEKIVRDKLIKAEALLDASKKSNPEFAAIEAKRASIFYDPFVSDATYNAVKVERDSMIKKDPLLNEVVKNLKAIHKEKNNLDRRYHKLNDRYDDLGMTRPNKLK